MRPLPRSGFLLILIGALVLCASEPAGQGERKGTAGKKISVVARASPDLREYFREIYGRTLADSAGEGALNRVLESQIDDFVQRLVEKNEQLQRTADELFESADSARQRQLIRRVREKAGGLEGVLRIWSDSLRPQGKSREPIRVVPIPTLELLLQEIALYERQINQFLFPEYVSVSVEELQSEGFHGTLRRIQRIAHALQ
jgi:hypothetical protein